MHILWLVPTSAGRNGITNMVIVTMLFGGGMVPSYILVVNILHLRNTYWALWLPGASQVHST